MAVSCVVCGNTVKVKGRITCSEECKAKREELPRVMRSDHKGPDLGERAKVLKRAIAEAEDGLPSCSGIERFGGAVWKEAMEECDRKKREAASESPCLYVYKKRVGDIIRRTSKPKHDHPYRNYHFGGEK